MQIPISSIIDLLQILINYRQINLGARLSNDAHPTLSITIHIQYRPTSISQAAGTAVNALHRNAESPWCLELNPLGKSSLKPNLTHLILIPGIQIREHRGSNMVWPIWE